MHNQFPKIFCFIDEYNKNYIKNLSKDIGIIYRNYNKKLNKQEIKNIKKICKTNKNKFYLANNVKLAIQLNLDGAYIPAFNKDLRIKSYIKRKEFKFLGSAHNISEIRTKENQGISCIFISPIFITKKNSKYLGIHKFNQLKKYTNKKIVCLGGIKKYNLNKIKLLNIHGFASVSLFKKKIKYIRY